MVSAAGVEVAIIDSQAAENPPGTIALRFTLSVEPPADWVRLFDGSRAAKSGSFNFTHSAPEVNVNVITWSVPVDDRGAAVDYVGRAVQETNIGYAAQDTLEIQEALARKLADSAGVESRAADEDAQRKLRTDADDAGAAQRSR